MKRLSTLLLLFAFIMLPTLVCAQTPQERLDAARVRYAGMSFDDVINDGLRLYQEGKTSPESYDQALDAFIYAQSLDPDEVILIYNIARCYHRLGNCEYALSNYETYKLKALDTDSYTDVTTYIDALRKQCGTQGTLVLRCTPQDALVSFDGNRLEPCDGIHKLKAGHHYLVAEQDGYAPQKLDVDVIYNEVTMQDVALKKDKAYKKAKSNVSPEEALHATSLKRAFWISGVAASSVGAVALITGGGLMLGSRPDDGNRDDGFYKGGIAVASVGAAALAAGIVLLVLDAVQTDEEESKNLQNYKNSLAVTPSLSFSQDGASAGLNIIF